MFHTDVNLLSRLHNIVSVCCLCEGVVILPQFVCCLTCFSVSKDIKDKFFIDLLVKKLLIL